VIAQGGVLCRFSKPPLEAAVEDRASPLAFRLIAVHLKSQAPSVDGPPAALADRIAENRARQRAQAAWVRLRVDEHLAAGEEVVVLGDFNDGPAGPGEGPSSVEIVAGDATRPERMLVNPFLAGRPPPTARFPGDAGRAAVEAAVDFILLSPGLAARAQPAWRVWHPDDEPGLGADLRDASDHFPVSLDLLLPSPGQAP
jgi:endonuclease/exonuclease/phosphatase family metal-dependent hydrolase